MPPAAVTTDVHRAGVLIADVVVLQDDEAYVRDGEGVPQAQQVRQRRRQRVVRARSVRLHGVAGQQEAALVGGQAQRAVPTFDLVVAGGGHPRVVPRGGADHVEPVGPRPRWVAPLVRVRQVTDDQGEQRADPVDAGHGVPGRRRAERVVGLRGAVIAETGEGERHPAPWRGPQGAAAGAADPVVDHLVEVTGVRFQPGEQGMVVDHILAGDGVGVDTGDGVHLAVEPAGRAAEPHPGAAHHPRRRP